MRDEAEIFAEALRQGSPRERAAFLDRVCGANVALRQEVEALLAAHEMASGILEAPPPGLGTLADVPSEPAEPPEPLGSMIGRYKLLERIGEGGMGAVYMAEQQMPVRRLVALKIIKPGMDSAQVIGRFEAERQALAMMDHPNIARVLDAGTTDAGRPYFVMELVRGVPITQYCDQNSVAPHQRLELFVQVCQAVQHAHQKGVIHRDLKPSNVLVTLHDGVPAPRVIDFGIAKAVEGQRLTERTLFTQFTQLIGTPLYMSPEQAELSGLDVDTRSDIYSLGVLLYELLTGTTPFEKDRLAKAAIDEVRRIIREEEPPRPSTRLSTLSQAGAAAPARRTDLRRLGQLVRGDLDWIVMKALEKDRRRRYETANALARDVQRHLSDEPVEAGPPSTAYRLRKFVRRNRGNLAAVLAVTVVLAGVATLLVYGRAREARQREEYVRQLQVEQGKTLAVAEEARRARAELLLRHGNSDMAAEMYFQATEAEPDNHWLWYLSTTLRLQIDDEEGYREHCTRLLHLTPTGAPRVVAERTVRACLLRPGAGIDLEHLSELADHVIAATTEASTMWDQLCKGLAEHRMGRHEAAINWLGRSRDRFPKYSYGRMQACLILAMAHHHLGQMDEAERWLIHAYEVLARPEMRNGPDHFCDRIMAHVLLREAAKLIPLPAARPSERQPLIQISNAEELARRGAFEAAAREYHRALKQYPEDHILLMGAACVQLQIDDPDGYRDYCRKMLTLFGATTNPVVAERVLKTCTVLPWVDADLPVLKRLAEVVERNATDVEIWLLLARGMFDYRMDQFDSAVVWLERARQFSHSGGETIACFVAAMAYHRLGKHVRARNLFDEGMQQLTHPGRIASAPPYDQIICHMIRSEAQALIHPAVSTQPSMAGDR